MMGRANEIAWGYTASQVTTSSVRKVRLSGNKVTTEEGQTLAVLSEEEGVFFTEKGPVMPLSLLSSLEGEFGISIPESADD